MEVISEGTHRKYIDDGSEIEYYKSWEDYKIQTLLCPNCEDFNIIKFVENCDSYKVEMCYEPKTETIYLYPLLKEFADMSPKAKDIRDTFREARTCFQGELYTSSVVMCRKTMEMLCLYFKIEQPGNLHGKLAKMRDEEIIDNKFYEWANVLKSFGNEAVHSSEKFSKEDTQDILDFTYALVEYCIDFNDKFENLLERRGKVQPSPDLETTALTEETINTLVQKLADNETSAVRYYAASTLAKRNIEIDKVIPVFLSLISSSKFSKNATNCLKTIGSKAVPVLINALENISNHVNVRSAAATILGDIGTNNPDVIESLVKALKDPNDDLQYKAGIALEELGNIAIDAFVKMNPSPPDS
ncbi:HEAT repeat domain-containing protein [Dolichospermum sp. UHCC 0406]|nr:HEAT repeat domain-containing protein [Dolichospermum sp. UHCC 0406]